MLISNSQFSSFLNNALPLMDIYCMDRTKVKLDIGFTNNQYNKISLNPDVIKVSLEDLENNKFVFN